MCNENVLPVYNPEQEDNFSCQQNFYAINMNIITLHLFTHPYTHMTCVGVSGHISSS